ncbi:oxidoreductase domain protein [Pirellula staleyi DSM 6068]|uniref:Oxidoreductase domain protein n=1 Tax=Pirellula staleyi (strain ATCC 27377 / DSM 6068 / ICPB 4128) TaxID=530564 RepID=D2QZ68_PIRSD|nr:Gfo/Idh/MocA family oxidoreductase [Pirellula staleyi]ADB18260.1 oxidoreductase domain protein [Pirellula staleyi DSM 6068]
MRLRAGIVGLGETWENRHRPALRALSDRFEVRAVCSEVSHLAEQAAREFNATPMDGFRALCCRDDLDVVLILSPEWYGPLPILAACDSGKSVYCGAALDIDDPREASRLKSRVEDSGIAFMAELPRRLAPATIRLKELIATRLGKPKLLFCHRRSTVEPAGTTRKRPSRLCPTMQREMIEQVDWCRYVAGMEPTSVIGISHCSSLVADGDDYQMMSLDFSPGGKIGEGPTAQISCGRYMPGNWPEAVAFRPPAALQVCCERGVAFIDLPSSLTWFDEAGRHMESLESERPVGERMLMHFYRAVTSLLRKTNDLEDAYRALSIVISARESCQSGQRIFLPGDEASS